MASQAQGGGLVKDKISSMRGFVDRYGQRRQTACLCSWKQHEMFNIRSSLSDLDVIFVTLPAFLSHTTWKVM